MTDPEFPDTGQDAQRIKLDTLPSDILEDILEYLPRHLSTCARVSKAFHAVVAQGILNKSAKLDRDNLDKFHQMLMSKTPQARAQRLAAFQKLGLNEAHRGTIRPARIDRLIMHVPGMQLVTLDVQIHSNHGGLATKLADAVRNGTIRHLSLLVEGEGNNCMRLDFSLSQTLQSLRIQEYSGNGWHTAHPGFQAPQILALQILSIQSWRGVDIKSPTLLLAIAEAAPALHTLKFDGFPSEQYLSLLRQCGHRIKTLGLSSLSCLRLHHLQSIDWKATCPNLFTLNFQGQLDPSDIRKLLSLVTPMPVLRINRLDTVTLPQYGQRFTTWLRIFGASPSLPRRPFYARNIV